MKNTPQVSIIINSFRDFQVLEECMKAVKKSDYQHIDVTVVDVGTEDIERKVKSQFPDVHIISMDKDLGPVAQRNLGYSSLDSNASYVMFIDNDIEPATDCIRKLVSLLEEHSSIAAVQSFQYSAIDRKSVNCLGGFMDKAGFPFMPNQMPHKLRVETDQRKPPYFPVTYAAGIICFRNSVLERLQVFGPFPPDYFHHFEDVDLSWKVKLLGYEVVTSSEAISFHKGGNTQRPGELIPPYDVFINTRNRFHTLFKHLSGWKLARYLPISICLELLRSFYMLFIRPRQGLAILKGVVWLVRRFRDVYRNRLEVQKIPTNF